MDDGDEDGESGYTSSKEEVTEIDISEVEAEDIVVEDK
jgi:hypothetical protein